MRTALLLLTCGASCEDPAREIEKCESANLLVDCCTSDESCLAYYEGLPYCRDPGPEGMCAGCADDSDCHFGNYCTNIGPGIFQCEDRN